MTHRPSTYWNVEVHDRISTPTHGGAQDVIRALALSSDEAVLDAGCASATFDLSGSLFR